MELSALVSISHGPLRNEWGTHHSLRIEISLPVHRLPRGAREKFRLVLHRHPGLFLRTLEHRVENPHLADPILEGGIIDWRLRIHDSLVEAAEDLLEGVRVAFAVAARQIGVAPGLRP